MSFITIAPDTLIRMCDRTIAKARAERDENAEAWAALPWHSGIADFARIFIGIPVPARPWMPHGGISGKEVLCHELSRAAWLVRTQPGATVRVDLDDLAYLENPD